MSAATSTVGRTAWNLRETLEDVLHRTRHELARAAFWPPAMFWHIVLTRGAWRPRPATALAVHEEFLRLLRHDEACAAAGIYPRSLLRETPSFPSVGDLPDAVVEMTRVLFRKFRNAWDDVPREIAESFPRYYRRTFHWQSDGWFSDRSARLYDFGVEFLFFGTVGPMRRLVLPPLVRALRGKKEARLLDVACGTGTFLRQVHAALPEAKLYGVDMSPWYIRHARKTLAHVAGVSLVVDAAEHLPFAARTFDAISSVFLFHELPRTVREEVLREARRVLRRGGLLVICDSIQKGDAKKLGLSEFLEWFPRTYHEPYYRSYQRDPLEALVQRCGFRVESTNAILFSKVVVARKL